jgi:hypothetical protein
MSIQIKPKQEIITLTITSINIFVSQVQINQNANITVAFYDENGVCVKNEGFVLEGENYENWTTDASLINYVCQKYNLTLQN